MQLSPTPTGIKPKLHKITPANKDWTLKATYVEVTPRQKHVLNSDLQ